jgi:hypothetical protein
VEAGGGNEVVFDVDVEVDPEAPKADGEAKVDPEFEEAEVELLDLVCLISSSALTSRSNCSLN